MEANICLCKSFPNFVSISNVKCWIHTLLLLFLSAQHPEFVAGFSAFRIMGLGKQTSSPSEEVERCSEGRQEFLLTQSSGNVIQVSWQARSFENAAVETCCGLVFCTGNAFSEQSLQLQSGFEMGAGVSCGYKQQPVCLYKSCDLNGELKNSLFPGCFLVFCFLFFLSIYISNFSTCQGISNALNTAQFLCSTLKKLGCELSEFAPCCLRNFVWFSVIWMYRSLLCLNTSGMR